MSCHFPFEASCRFNALHNHPTGTNIRNRVRLGKCLQLSPVRSFASDSQVGSLSPSFRCGSMPYMQNFPVFIVFSFSSAVSRPSFARAVLTRSRTLSLTVIFISQFMLDLHGVHLSDTTAYASTTSRFGAHSGICFSSSVVGNTVGVPLSFSSSQLH